MTVQNEKIIMSNAIARKLSVIQEKGAMRSIDVANVLKARPETVSRWNQGKAFPRPDAKAVAGARIHHRSTVRHL